MDTTTPTTTHKYHKIYLLVGLLVLISTVLFWYQNRTSVEKKLNPTVKPVPFSVEEKSAFLDNLAKTSTSSVSSTDKMKMLEKMAKSSTTKTATTSPSLEEKMKLLESMSLKK